MIRIIVIIAILAGVAVMGNTAGNKNTIIYEKYLPGGRIVVVEKEVRVENREVRFAEYKPSKSDQKEYSKEITIGRANFNIENIAMKIRDKKGVEAIVWRKENKHIIFPSGNAPDYNLIIHDVVESGDKISILFSALTTDVETLKMNNHGDYDIIYQKSLFRQSSLRHIAIAKLVWVDELYALISFEPKSSEIWRIAKDKHEQVYIARIGQQ